MEYKMECLQFETKELIKEVVNEPTQDPNAYKVYSLKGLLNTPCPLLEVKPNNSILTQADKIVNGERRVDYGANESFNKIASMASIMTSKELSPQDCIKVLIAVKMVRESFKHKEDNLVDACGYMELLNQIINK